LEISDREVEGGLQRTYPAGRHQHQDPALDRGDDPLGGVVSVLSWIDLPGRPMIARFPSRRPSTPEEIDRAVLFLAGDDASNIHGAILSADGGAAALAV
jgi:NAD(P)-dependent dehydrogenase (short-subunit alcohol dehydrogenase family)